jgi:hypothetical protein
MGISPMGDATPRVIFVAFARRLHEPVWMPEEGHSGGIRSNAMIGIVDASFASIYRADDWDM